MEKTLLCELRILLLLLVVVIVVVVVLGLEWLPGTRRVADSRGPVFVAGLSLK